MPQKFANYASTTLSAPIIAGATSIGVTSSSGFPTLAVGDYFFATIIDQVSAANGANPPVQREIVRVTAITGFNWTVERGQDGTAAQAFAADSVIELRFAAISARQIAPVEIDVTFYGATGDGVTDDTAAVAAAAAAASLNSCGLYFPTGSFLTDPIVLGANVLYVRGDSSASSFLKFKRQAYVANTSMINFAACTKFPVLHDIGIDVDDALFNNTWTVYYACNHFEANNVNITGQAAIGFMASAGGHQKIRRVRLQGTGVAGIAVGVYCDTAASYMTVEDVYQGGPHAYSVNLASGQFNTIRNCQSFNASVFAFTLANNLLSTIDSCQAFESGFEGAHILDSQYCSIVNCRLFWNAGGSDFGISLNNTSTEVKFCVVENNVIINSYKAGIALAESVSNCLIQNNDLYNCGVRAMAAPPSSMMGAYTVTAGRSNVRNRIQNNNCYADAGAVTYGFIETQAGGTTVDYNFLDQNTFVGATTDVVLVGANSRQDGRFQEGLVLLGVLRGADFNSVVDQAIRINGGRYRLEAIVVENASLNLNTAAGGFYTGAAKGGVTVVAAAQTYVANTTSVKQTFCTIAAGGQDTLTVQTIYLSLTTPQGAAATADVFIYGRLFAE